MKSPFENSDTNKRYYTYDCFLKRKFGGKVIKIPLDGGFTCPNIDGTKGHGGCIYCSKRPLKVRNLQLEEQFNAQREILLKKWGREELKERYIQYFQMFSNTYAPASRLRELYYRALSLPNTVGMSIATRCDCINDDNIGLLSEINEKTYLTVELGLQTVHEETAKLINRGHTYEEFLKTYEKLKDNNFNVCVHIINGLPTETTDMMLETAKQVGILQPHGLKIHMLYVEKNTELHKMWEKENFHLLSLEEYTQLVCNQLEFIPKDTWIGRITGDGESDMLVAPDWTRKKFVVMNEIDKEFAKRNTYQGINF